MLRQTMGELAQGVARDIRGESRHGEGEPTIINDAAGDSRSNLMEHTK